MYVNEDTVGFGEESTVHTPTLPGLVGVPGWVPTHPPRCTPSGVRGYVPTECVDCTTTRTAPGPAPSPDTRDDTRGRVLEDSTGPTGQGRSCLRCVGPECRRVTTPATNTGREGEDGNRQGPTAGSSGPTRATLGWVVGRGRSGWTVSDSGGRERETCRVEGTECLWLSLQKN